MQMIVYLRKLLILNDDSFVFVYELRNVEYRILFFILIVFLLSFIFKKIKKEQIYQEFGFFLVFFIKKEE